MSDGIDRDDGGEYRRTVTDEEILEAIRQQRGPSVTATELAAVLPIGRRAIRERLSRLTDAGIVERKDVGARAVVWWITEEDDNDPAPAAPLRNLVGLVEEETAEQARKRSKQWREEFDDELRIGDT